MKPTNYTCPPASRIAKEMNLPIETARTLRKLAKGEILIRDNPDFPVTNQWAASCYNYPRRIDLILSAMNDLRRGGFQLPGIPHARYCGISEHRGHVRHYASLSP